MKRIKAIISIVAIALFAFVSESYAQGRFGKDSVLCVNNLNFYRDFYNQGDYAAAAPLWINAFKYCPPKASSNLFIHGKKIMRYRIDNYTGDESGKEALIDSLLLLHEIRSQAYPKNAKTAKEDKIRDMMFFYGSKDSKSKEIYQFIDSYVDEYGASSDAALVVNGMIKASDAYKAGELQAEDVMTLYTKYSKVMEDIAVNTQDADFADKEAMLQNAFVQSGVATCDNIVKVFKPRYEQNMNDTTLLKTIASLLSSKECTDSDLFSSVVAQMYKLKPSASSAYFLYRFFTNQGESDKALNYLKEAANNSSGADKGTYLYELATIQYKNRAFGAAVSSARQAAELNPKHAGKAEMLIGNIWASSSCGGSEMDKRARFWVATDCMIRAKQKDASLAAEADKNIARYRGYFPKTEDAFMYDLTDGKSYTVSCGGMTATTTVRTNR